jgi:hypothetical protein
MPDIDTHVTELEHIFSAPLAAVMKADFMAARQFADHLESYGFVHPEPGAEGAAPGPEHLGELRMVSFTFDQMQGGQPERRMMRVPALSLIPLPLLQIKQAELSYGVRVLSAQRRDDKKPLRLLKQRADAERQEPARYAWRAMLAAGSPHGETRSDRAPHLDANIHVKVQVVQADVPAGLAHLLSLMGENAHVKRIAAPNPGESAEAPRKERP